MVSLPDPITGSRSRVRHTLALNFKLLQRQVPTMVRPTLSRIGGLGWVHIRHGFGGKSDPCPTRQIQLSTHGAVAPEPHFFTSKISNCSSFSCQMWKDDRLHPSKKLGVNHNWFFRATSFYTRNIYTQQLCARVVQNLWRWLPKPLPGDEFCWPVLLTSAMHLFLPRDAL